MNEPSFEYQIPRASGLPARTSTNWSRSSDRPNLVIRILPRDTMGDTTSGNLWKEREAGYKIFVGSIDKPDLDERDYRILELRNGLKAVLVNDPQADKSAACLRVAVGSLYDPVRVLTHLSGQESNARFSPICVEPLISAST